MTLTGRILVTGAGGFLGSCIVSRARAKGLDAVAAQRRAVPAGVEFLDVCDADSVDTTMRRVRPQVVIHCAAYGVNYAEQDLDAAIAVNVHGSLRTLAAAARYAVQRFVHIGSCAEYGSKLGPISEDALLVPTASYGASKAAATLLLQELARTLGVCLVVARPFGIWGPGEADYRLAPQIVDACMRRTALKLTGCEVLRDYTYVEDMADRILALAQTQAIRSSIVVNVASGRGVLLRDLVVSIARLLDGEELMQFGALPYRPTEMPSLVADVTRLRELLGELSSTSVAEGVRQMVTNSQSSRA